MLKDLYRQCESIVQSWLMPRTADINSWEKRSLRRITDGSFRPATPEMDGDLLRQVSHLARKAGLKGEQKIILYADRQPNAYCMGNGTILIASSLLERFTPEERADVIAHELVHRRQTITGRLAPLAGIITAIAGSAAITRKALPATLASEKKSLFGVTLIAAVFTLCYAALATLIKIPLAALKRAREYDADRGALLLTGDLEAAKSKFAKYAAARQEREAENNLPVPPTDQGAARQHAPPDAPLDSEPSPARKFLRDLYRSHPTHEERIAHLERVKKQMDSGELKDAPLSRYF